MQLHRRLYSYWLLIHPFPVTMVVAFATLLAVATARATLDPSRLVRAILTLFFSQAVVGISNDYHDRTLDFQGQPQKPLANGSVAPKEAMALIVIAFLLMLALAFSIGPIVLALALAGTMAGLLYNLVLRGTPFSWFPYVLGFTILPVAVWVAMERFDPRQLALIPIGIPLLIGVHLAQTLPDIESDLRVGIRGLSVSLGRERAVIVCWSAFLAAEIIALGSGILMQSNLPSIAAATILSVVLVATSVVRYRRDQSSATLRGNFRLTASSAVMLTAGWLFALRT